MKLNEPLFKNRKSVAYKKCCSSKIIKDMLSTNNANYYQCGLLESMDEDDFRLKLESRPVRIFMCRYFQWLLKKRKTLFVIL